MADNVAITAGSGTSVATDEIGGAHYQRVKIVWGADGTANDTSAASGKPLPSTLYTSTGTEINFTASSSSSATFTPAASSHTAGDVVGGAQEFASMGISASRIMITSASLRIDSATAQATAWTLYLFNITPPSAVADDAAHTLPSGDRASFLDKIALGTAVDEGATQYIKVDGINKQIKLAGTSVFGYLVNNTTLSTEAVAHVVELHAVQL
jgi:hypothetical protein